MENNLVYSALKKCKNKAVLKEFDDFKYLDEETIEKMNSVVTSTNEYNRINMFKEESFKKAIEGMIDDKFKDTEELFRPYIKQHKDIEKEVNDMMYILQEKNFKKEVSEEDISNAEKVYLKAEEYINKELPKTMKQLNEVKKGYTLKAINKKMAFSMFNKSMQIKILAFCNKLISSAVQIHCILEEELDCSLIIEANEFLKLEIDVAQKIKDNNINNNTEYDLNIVNIYEDVVLNELNKVNSIAKYKTPKTYTELIKLAEENGFSFCRQSKTSHAIFKNKNNKTVVIPNKGNVTVPIGTQFKILKSILC